MRLQQNKSYDKINSGWLPKRFKGPVLKTDRRREARVGSNPTPSATKSKAVLLTCDTAYFYLLLSNSYLFLKFGTIRKNAAL